MECWGVQGLVHVRQVLYQLNYSEPHPSFIYLFFTVKQGHLAKQTEGRIIL